MITIFKSIQNNLKEISKFENDCWINVSNPTNEELEKLSQKLKIPLDFLTDPLDVDERARIDAENGCILIVLRVSRFDEKEVDIPFTTLPVGIIITKEIAITICSKDVRVILDFINGKVRNFSTENKSRFLLQIFHRTALLYLKDLREINNRTTMVEKELHKAMKNEELIKLLNIEKSLVFFTTSLRSNELMMERLQKTEIIKMNPDDEDLMEDVITESKQAIEMSNVYSNILSGMMDAFASVISNNLNVVVKFLAAVTIILMIPTLIASLYGMNVKLPFQDSSHAFLITLSISFTLSAIGVLIFIKRKWF
ncbi:MAG: magnesium transporter [Candidatus Moranbacteria bacterium CG_4_10_14_3_um_filter_44_15]|nr:MAG: magnesium transporter [Candidatus Moranbacteria bacterium CG06_land_8_20_14_3_00_43_56]PIX90930.1 MAG: magnesium transporter [Candidatus Moranbacteria bacterium CG_4_10_14_3_um_filter_44_15]